MKLNKFVKPVVFVLMFMRMGVASDNPPANAWMKIPTPVASSDNTTPALRRIRDDFFDASIGSASPLTTQTASAFHVAPGSHYRLTDRSISTPEIPSFPGRTIVIGKFTAYHSVLTPSRRSIYTDVNVVVSKVLEGNASLTDGSEITIDLPGGSVSTKNGEVLSYLTDPKEYFIQPGKAYLFVLSFHAGASFYSLVDTWDLSSGVAKPMSRSEEARAADGTSSIVGVSEDELPAVIQMLSSSDQK